MKTIYQEIKNKIQKMDIEQADKYIDKMYNNGVITVKELERLDNFNITRNLLL